MTPPHADAPTKGFAEAAPEEVLRGVREVVAGVLQRPVEDVGPDDPLEYGLEVDSMALIEINIALEQHFRVTMPDFIDPAGVTTGTVADLAAVVAARVNGGAANGRRP